MLHRSLLSFFLVFASASASLPQSEAVRASRTWEVRRYSIQAVLPDSDADRGVGVLATLELSNVSQSPASSLTLRISPTAEVSEVSVGGVRSDFSRGEEKVGAGSLQRISVRGVSVAPGARLEVRVAYRLKVEENSGLLALSSAGSQFLPLGFWYPTPTSWFFTRGADFAPTTLKVSGGLSGTVVAPGTALRDGSFESGSSIQPFFLAGSWDEVESSGVKVFLPKGWGQAEKSRAREIADYVATARDSFAARLGDFGAIPLKVVAVRRGGGFSGGGVILIDEGAFRRDRLDAQTAVVAADAVAKVWLGNKAVVSGDGYGVVREGLARFLATRFVESRFGKDVADVERLRQRTAYGAVSRRDGAVTQISPIDDFYYSAMTNKGAAIWRKTVAEVGEARFFDGVRDLVAGGAVDLAGLRRAFPEKGAFFDYAFDQVTDGNLLVGIPQNQGGGRWKVALRNTGPVDVKTVAVATLESGKTVRFETPLKARGFSDFEIESEEKVVRVEVDPEKLELQSDYSDDVAPRMFSESDLVLMVKSPFDRQDYASAEREALAVLRRYERFDDVRTLLARALAAQGRLEEAEREFDGLLRETLPSARTIAWANAGLGEIALKAGRISEAVRFFDAAMKADAELGATVMARRGRASAKVASADLPGIREFFAAFDKAAVSNRKSEVDDLIMPGEVVRFSRGIAGQAQQWQTTVRQVDRLSEDSVVVEVGLTVRIINKAPESGSGVFRLSKASGSWKISAVDSFEVR